MTYGATLEYGLSPVWGFSLDYYHLPLTANNNSKTININTDLNTSDLNATLNLTRLIYPQSTSKIYVNGAIGLGYAYYTFATTLPYKGVDLKSDYAYSIPFTLSIEYNLSRTIAFGSKVQYRAFNKDNLEGVSSLNFKGNSNDFVGSGTFFLRYKFNSGKKEHLRNIKMDLFSPDNGLILSKLNTEKIKNLDNVISKLEGIVNYQNHLIDSMNVYLAKIGSTLNGVGIQDVREAESNASINTPSDSNGRTLKDKVEVPKTKESIEDVPAIYFDFNKTDLDDKALVAISKIANKMKLDPSLYVEVRGYCDNLDNEKQNNQLSQRRSDRVKSELVNYWKIPYNHIITNAKVNVAESQLKSRPNRRCDIFFVKL
jgi:outer membrane protein OmpA-like peptidoglycan-associated protein